MARLGVLAAGVSAFAAILGAVFAMRFAALLAFGSAGFANFRAQFEDFLAHRRTPGACSQCHAAHFNTDSGHLLAVGMSWHATTTCAANFTGLDTIVHDASKF